MGALEKIETDEFIIIKELKKDLPEILKKLLDIVGSSIVSCHTKKPIKTLFAPTEKYQPYKVIELADGRKVKLNY